MSIAASVGTTFSVGTGSDKKSVGHLTSIGSPSIKVDTIESTALDTEGGYKTYVASWKGGGELDLEGFLDGADEGQTALYTALGTGATVACEIAFPTAIGKKWTFNAIVTGFETSVGLSDLIGFTATLTVVGAPTLAA